MASDPKQAPVPVAELEYEHSPLEDAVIRYRKQLILVGTLALLGTVGYFGSKLWKDSQHKNAALAFTRAETVGELRNVATAHSGLPAAGNALLKAAQLLAQDGKGKEAIDELNQFLTAYPQHPLADLAKFRLADVQMQEGATQDAMTRFLEVSNTPGSPYAALALLRVADQKWQDGKIDEAQNLYQELLTKHGGNRMFELAEQRLKQIKITPPVLVDYVPEPTPAPGTPGATPSGLPETNLAPPSAAALDKAISTPGLLGDDSAPAGTSLTPPDAPPTNEDPLLPPPVIPAPPK
jgi:predicted negative regulator of RcsB-dependent stress response